MKFTTFRNITSLVLFAAVGGSCYGCYFYWSRAITHEELERQQQLALTKQADAEREARDQAAAAERLKTEQARKETERVAELARANTPGAYWAKADNLREVDRAALAVLDRPVVDKIKDATRGQPFKVNAYADDKVRFNRLKLDLDRDNKDDETWTVFADGRIERKVSTKDNGSYNETYRLELSGWVDLSAPAPVPVAAAATTASTTSSTGLPTQRAVDVAMANVLQQPVQEKIKDATKGQPFKINLYSDDRTRFNRAKVDLDRDDKWDESWTFKSATDIERQVSPDDNEQFTEVYAAHNGQWVKKP
jgi:guanyl-specific ribonuclease Sa